MAHSIEPTWPLDSPRSSALTTTSSARDQLRQMVRGMAAMLNAKADDMRLEGYVETLIDLPLAYVPAGLKRAITGWTWPDMPKPAHIREAVQAVAEEAHAKAERDAKSAAARSAAQTDRQPFGRMSKAMVLQHWGSFEASPCDCVACWDAQVPGPPRFVPDGVSPVPVCVRCDDAGWTVTGERTDTTAPTCVRCGCLASNPNLVDGTRAHTIDMGRWLHGAELAEWYAAKAQFDAAMRRVTQRLRA